MDIKVQVILEYLEQGCGYRKLHEKYGISRSTFPSHKSPLNTYRGKP